MFIYYKKNIWNTLEKIYNGHLSHIFKLQCIRRSPLWPSTCQSLSYNIEKQGYTPHETHTYFTKQVSRKLGHLTSLPKSLQATSTSYVSLFLSYDLTKEKSHPDFWPSYSDNDQNADVSGTFNSDWVCEIGCLYVCGRGYNIQPKLLQKVGHDIGLGLG